MSYAIIFNIKLATKLQKSFYIDFHFAVFIQIFPRFCTNHQNCASKEAEKEVDGSISHGNLCIADNAVIGVPDSSIVIYLTHV